MSGVQIMTELSRGLKIATTTVNTSVLAGGVAQAAITTAKSVTNPLYILGTGALNTGIFRPDLASKVTSRVLTGSGSSAFDDAVKALTNLTERHGVAGIKLSGNPNLYGGIAFKDTPGMFISGQPVIDRIGREAAFRIDKAARYVMDFIQATT